MAGAPVQNRKIGLLKSKLLRPALTSHFICNFPIPYGAEGSGLKEWIRRQAYTLNFNPELIDSLQLFCAEASLPGASLLTHEINNDYTGVTERHAYRRSFDDRTDFTFYVDTSYDIIKFFQLWISYIANEKQFEETEQGPNYSLGYESPSYNYRVRFPTEYMTNELTITKFERDFSGPYLEYKFFNAFPVSINSMPVSYDSSQLLKCTVSFTYSRYVMYDVQSSDIRNGLERLTSKPNTILNVNEVGQGQYQIQYVENGQVKTIITNKKPPEQ